MIASDFEKLSEIIPGTFGEAFKLYPWLKCEGHEWDNRTTIENTEWIINELCVMAKSKLARTAVLNISDVIVSVCPKCKGDQIAETKKGYQCCYTDCLHEWQTEL